MDERSLAEMAASVRNLERIVCGPPPLEERMREFAERIASHKGNNARQDAIDVRHALEKEQEHRDQQHNDNQGQFRQLFRLVYIGVGIVITLQVVLLALIKH